MLTYLTNISSVTKDTLTKLCEENQVMLVDGKKTVGNINAECKTLLTAMETEQENYLLHQMEAT